MKKRRLTAAPEHRAHAHFSFNEHRARTRFSFDKKSVFNSCQSELTRRPVVRHYLKQRNKKLFVFLSHTAFYSVIRIGKDVYRAFKRALARVRKIYARFQRRAALREVVLELSARRAAALT